MRRSKKPPGGTPADESTLTAPSDRTLPTRPSQGRVGVFSRAVRQTLSAEGGLDVAGERQGAIAAAFKADPALGAAATLLSEIVCLPAARDDPNGRALPPASSLPLLF